MHSVWDWLKHLHVISINFLSQFSDMSWPQSIFDIALWQLKITILVCLLLTCPFTNYLYLEYICFNKIMLIQNILNIEKVCSSVHFAHTCNSVLHKLKHAKLNKIDFLFLKRPRKTSPNSRGTKSKPTAICKSIAQVLSKISSSPTATSCVKIAVLNYFILKTFQLVIEMFPISVQ